MMLEDKALGPAMINVNPVVDPSAALTDPSNQNYKPNSRAELKAALESIISEIPDEQASKVYDKIKGATAVPDEESEDKMKDTKAENLVRSQIRKIISELFIKEAGSALPAPKFVRPENPTLDKPAVEIPEELNTAKEIEAYLKKRSWSAAEAKAQAEKTMQARLTAQDAEARRKKIADIGGEQNITKLPPGKSPLSKSKSTVSSSTQEKLGKSLADEEEVNLSKGVKLENEISKKMKEVSDTFLDEDTLDSVKEAFDETREELDISGSPGYGTFEEVVSTRAFKKRFKSISDQDYNELCLEMGGLYWQSMQEKSEDDKRGYNVMAATTKQVAEELQSLYKKTGDESFNVSESAVNKDTYIALGKVILHNALLAKYPQENLLGRDVISDRDVNALMEKTKNISDPQYDDLVIQIFDDVDGVNSAPSPDKKRSAKIKFVSSVKSLIDELLGINFSISDKDMNLNASLQDLLSEIGSSSGDVGKIKEALEYFIYTAVIERVLGVGKLKN